MPNIKVEDLRLTGPWVLIKRRKLHPNYSDIIVIPDLTNYYSVMSDVVSVGPGEVFLSNTREVMPVKTGDVVLLWGGYVENPLGDELYIVHIDQIEGIVSQ